MIAQSINTYMATPSTLQFVAGTFISLSVILPASYFLDLMPFTSNSNPNKKDICTFLNDRFNLETPYIERAFANGITAFRNVNINKEDCSTTSVWIKTSAALFATGVTFSMIGRIIKFISIQELNNRNLHLARHRLDNLV